MCVFSSLQKRHNADSVVNKKECQGIENHLFFRFFELETLCVVGFTREHAIVFNADVFLLPTSK